MRNFFNFKQFDAESFLLTNDFGCHVFLNAKEFRTFLTAPEKLAGETLDKLYANFFLTDPMELYSHEPVRDLRAMKSYLFSSTALHIFVVTNRCNLQCVYCQAQSGNTCRRGDMTEEIGKRAVDIALQSPSEALTFEFQGGEPLFNFQTIKTIVEYTEAVKGNKTVNFTIVSNFTLLTEEILQFLINHRVSISTSLDGPELLHDKNRRPRVGAKNYPYVVQGIKRIREKGVPVGAIQTTTRFSLKYAREIVREYVNRGLYGIFLRPLTPLGFAKEDWEQIGYSPEEFLTFYKEAFDEILKVNLEGTRFPEFHATYFLRKILCGMSDNYMELRSPCGASVGQLAYYYDGNIYTCDEARMVAEAGENAFCLGTVFDSTYASLMGSRKCRATCSASVLEGIPGCCDCVYQPYCGVCPVVHFAHGGDPFAKAPHHYRCRIYEGILDFLFSLIKNGNLEIQRVLNTWVGGLEHEENE